MLMGVVGVNVGILSFIVNIINNIRKGISQNMSFSLLPFDHEDVFNLQPSVNNFNNTLLLIETVKNMPNHSVTCLDRHEPQRIPQQPDSLLVDADRFEKPVLQTPEIKRRKTGCTCRKTNCLKNYCQCFSSGKECTPECACYGCYNTHEHSDLVKQTKAEIKCKSSRKTTPGCICKKSQCQKKYCECFNAGVACTEACKCLDCENNTPHSHASQQSSQDTKNKRMQKTKPRIVLEYQSVKNDQISQNFSSLPL